MLRLEMSCSPDDLDAIEFCAMPTVKLQTNATNSSIDFNYFIDDDEVCPRIMENIRVVTAVVNQFVILYGCTDYGEDHEEGAWILGYKNNVTESMNHLNDAFTFMKNSSAKIGDFLVFNSSSVTNLTGIEVSDKKILHLNDKREHDLSFSVAIYVWRFAKTFSCDESGAIAQW